MGQSSSVQVSSFLFRNICKALAAFLLKPDDVRKRAVLMNSHNQPLLQVFLLLQDE